MIPRNTQIVIDTLPYPKLKASDCRHALSLLIYYTKSLKIALSGAFTALPAKDKTDD